tara:strand:+ start:435 stop:650 length:216 start_codon:yes stop_codon:yes gene_type:complete
MANSINWGSVYCQMITDESFGSDTAYSTNNIPDLSAPTCWGTFALTADLTSISGTAFLADTTNYKASATQK